MFVTTEVIGAGWPVWRSARHLARHASQRQMPKELEAPAATPLDRDPFLRSTEQHGGFDPALLMLGV